MEAGTKLYETSKYRCLVDPRKQSDSLFLLLCGVESCLPGSEFHTSGRPGYHLHVILSGKGTLCVRGEETALHFGQMFITKPGEDTWYRADETDPWSYCWMSYDGQDAQRYTEAAGFSKGVNWLNCSIDTSRYYALVKQVLDQPELNLACDLLRAGKLAEFLSLAIQTEYKRAQTPRREAEYSTNLYVEYAVNFIHSNYATARISDVANYIGIHRSYLTGIFKKKMGVSPQEYLMQCRMKTASILLLESNLSVQEISQRVGYDNSLTFSKIFKSYYGVSPKHYRLERRPHATPDGVQNNQDEVNEP